MKKTPSFTEEKALYEKAFAAAVAATEKTLAENPGSWFPCGFAWVRIRPARGKFVKFLREICEDKHGYVDEFGGGYVVYNPSKNPTQWVDAKEAGARAFAAVLLEAGMKVTVETRLD